MRITTVLALALMANILASCDSNHHTSAFCEQAEKFSIANGGANHLSSDYLAELIVLRDLAPSELQEDLSAIVEFEELYDPQETSDLEVEDIGLRGKRVGVAIEATCAIQLPGVVNSQ
ncbi:MAG: hypothetical protein OXN79_07845 [bacterium]|nr:hypothetical protein [bacterium]